MNHSRRLFLKFAISLIAFGLAPHAYAQIGPDLIPPGLEPNHPINAYSINDAKKSLEDDWRHEASWELNTADIVFSAAKKRQLISEAPSTIHVITDRDISAHGWRTLAEIMRHVPGVQTQTTHSQFQSVMIRGLVGTENNNSRILWLQNGVPMNDVRDSGIWLDETYPVEMIKRIEVVLGPGSALYGSGAFQGVVNIFTKDPADINPYGEYRIALQNNLTFKASAIAAYNSEDKDFGILGHVAGNTTQGPGLIGSYIYEDYSMVQGGANVGSGKTVNDYFYDRIDSPNSDKHWYNIDFKLHYKSLKWNLGFTDIYAGADGSEYLPYIVIDNNTINASMSNDNDKYFKDNVFDHEVPIKNSYRFNRLEFYTDLIYDTSFGDSVSFLSVISYRLNEYRFENYAGFDKEIKVSIRNDDNGTITNVEDNKIFSYKNNFEPMQHKLYGLAQVQWRIYEANELIGGLVLEYHNIDANGEFSYGTDTSEGKNDNQIYYLTPSIFLQDEQRFWNDRIILTLGGRFDAYKVTREERDYAPSWRFAFLGKWTDWMTMRVSYGYSFKEPSLYQLYADSIDYHGNKDLKPETLHNVELSFLFTPTYFMKIRLDGFATIIDDLIVVAYNDKSLKYKNLGIDGRYEPTQDSDAKLFGFELSLDTSIGKNWNLYSHYNFLYSTIDISEDNELLSSYDSIPDDAMHRLKVGATYMNDILTADMAMFLVAGTPKTKSVFWFRDKYATPIYAILQPQITVNLGANIGAMLQGSYAFSENMTTAPGYRYYYEKEGVPVSRYSVMFSLLYPFRNDR